jgi:glucose/mannose-6-phosphate isomerase
MDYELPENVDKNTLIIISSYSGNTEETISCFEQALEDELPVIVVTAGGIVSQMAQENKIETLLIVEETQPRLLIGVFISAVICILQNCKLIENKTQEILSMSEQIDNSFNEGYAKEIALKLMSRVPIIYSTDNNWGMAKVIKIKFNENSKVPSFWNFFPELNHNEMEGYSNLIMAPYFLIFRSQFTNIRNHKRIEIFAEQMKQRGIESEIIEMEGDSNLEEMMNAVYLADHITYFLAEEYEIDPEPVDVIELFKSRLKDG